MKRKKERSEQAERALTFTGSESAAGLVRPRAVVKRVVNPTDVLDLDARSVRHDVDERASKREAEPRPVFRTVEETVHLDAPHRVLDPDAAGTRGRCG